MMADSNKNSLAGRELQGMALFAAAAFPLVLVSIAWWKGGAEGGGGTAAVAAAIVQVFGFGPPILCSAGFAGVGVALLLGRGPVEVGRHLSGFLFSAMGLAVALGAVAGPAQAGSFGANTGGALAG